MSSQPRPVRPPWPAAPHGAITPAELRALGAEPDEIIDFSVSINPFGPTPAVRQAAQNADFGNYPDPEALELREALADRWRRSPEEILVGNGAGELIWLAAQAYLQAGDRALIIGPTYGEYARAAALAGAQLQFWRAQPEDDFGIHPRAIAQMLAAAPRVVFLCHPNNPTGQIFPLDALAAWLRNWPETLFVVDEAYIDFVEQGESALQLRANNLLVLRSLTKAQALAGLRLGYALGPRPVIAALRQLQIPWSVNAPAQAAGLAALQDEALISRQIRQLRQNKGKLVQELAGLGLPPVPSATHYFLLPVGNAAEFRRRLLAHGLVVRDATSFGLPGHVRIATRTSAQNQRLIAAISTTQK